MIFNPIHYALLYSTLLFHFTSLYFTSTLLCSTPLQSTLIFLKAWRQLLTVWFVKRLLTSPQVCMYVYACRYVCTYTRTHPHPYWPALGYVCMYYLVMYVHIHVHVHIQILVHTAELSAHIAGRSVLPEDVGLGTYMRKSTYIYIRTYIHTHTYTCIHTYIHTHTHK